MVSMNADLLKKIQEVELEIAAEVFRICEKNDIRCSLVGGSAIGAIRHHGFIPWDDDIDLAMPRPDYERFIEACKQDLKPQYFLQCFETEENCAYIFGKVRKNGTMLPEKYSGHINMHQGVWVDIFVYDKVSDDPAIRQKDLRKLFFYRNLLTIKTGFKMPENRSSLLEKVAYRVGKIPALLLSRDYLIRKCEQIATSHENEEAQFLFPYGGAYGNDKELVLADFFDELIEVPFEDKTFKLIKKYDVYLTELFGDYMTPPPPEKRQANHFLEKNSIIV